ncbi:MAG: hypothetical protein JNK56_05510, partial [Myxococcales bacterium]|nr:hypothetical protein [Myxococcales bacterium]
FADPREVPDRFEVALRYGEYAARYLAGNPRAKLSGLARHVLGLFTGQPGAREFRRLLTGPTSESPVAVMARAVAAVQRAQSARAS